MMTGSRFPFGRLSALILALALTGCAGAPPAPPGPDVVGPRKVVALVPDAQAGAAMRAAAEAEGYRRLDETRLSGLGLSMLTFEMAPGVTGPEAIAALEGAVPTSTVGINHAYRPQQGAGGVAGLDYADAMMRWPAGGCEARAPVGMIDTGVDPDAPALAGARVVSRAFFDGAAAEAAHGADVAAVLAGGGRLRGATLYSANVFGGEAALGLAAGADALVRALDWMAAEEVRFVNLSLAGPYNKLLDLAVERAAARGLILVAAVGNDGPEAEPMYPAGFSGVIAVTAVDANGRVYRNAVRGAHVDVAAPGVDVLVRSGGGARFVTGTSIAAPFVTARLAADPALDGARGVAEARARLAGTSAELGPAGRDSLYGYGLALAEGLCGS
jgi:hypothetical protein